MISAFGPTSLSLAGGLLPTLLLPSTPLHRANRVPSAPPGPFANLLGLLTCCPALPVAGHASKTAGPPSPSVTVCLRAPDTVRNAQVPKRTCWAVKVAEALADPGPDNKDCTLPTGHRPHAESRGPEPRGAEGPCSKGSEPQAGSSRRSARLRALGAPHAVQLLRPPVKLALAGGLFVCPATLVAGAAMGLRDLEQVQFRALRPWSGGLETCALGPLLCLHQTV